MQNKIPIFLSSDNNYAPFVATTIASICDHTKSFCEFYVLDSGISQMNKQKIAALSQKFSNFSIEYILIDSDKYFKNFRNIRYLGLATYNRFLIPDLKPFLNKIIYLDTDIIVLEDIQKLYNENLNGKSLGAVWETWLNLDSSEKRNKQLALPNEYKYFNAGILLIDCTKWKTTKIKDKLFEIEKLYRNKLQAADQDVLNLYYCNEGYKILPPKYNWPTKYSKTISCDPAIIHYLGKNKPWFVHPNIPEKQNLQITIYKNIFWHYAKMTEFYETLIEQTQYKSLGDLLLFRVHSLINNKHNEQSSEIKFKIKNSQ